MPFRSSEVAYVLALLTAMLVAKHIPLLQMLPLTQMAGILCFSFAVYLALRLYMLELAQVRSGE